MGNERAQGRIAAGLVVILAVIALNVLPRVVSLPDIELPSLPDIPGWVRTVLKVKNVVLVAVAVAVVGGFVLKEIGEHRKGGTSS